MIWAIAIFGPFTRFTDWIMPGDALEPTNIPLHMATFHTMFNLLNIALVIGFVPQLARLVNRLIRDKKVLGSDHLHFDSALLPRTGELSMAEAERDVKTMADLTRELVTGFTDLFENPPEDMKERVQHFRSLEQKSDRMAVDTTTFLLQTSANRVSEPTMIKLTGLLRVVAELEDICDCGYRLVLLAERKHRKGREVPANAITQVRQFSEIVLRFMAFTTDCLGREIRPVDMESAYQLENFIDRMRKDLRKESMRRMSETGAQIKAEMLYIDVLNNMESIGNHCINVLQSLRHAD